MENPDKGSVEEGVTQAKQDTLLRFRVGPFRFSVPAVEVEGIIVPPQLTVIPLTPPHSKGVFMYHERLASAISLRSKFGLPDNDDENLGQLILGEVSAGLAGFWVDEVYETTDSSELEWRAMPDFVPHAAFESFGVHENEVVMATTMQKLYDVPAEQMALMLASMRKNFDFPEDVPPVAAEGMPGDNASEDEDAFGDLVDSERTGIDSSSDPGTDLRSDKETHDSQHANVIEFPKHQDQVEKARPGKVTEKSSATPTSTSAFERLKQNQNSSAASTRTMSGVSASRTSGMPGKSSGTSNYQSRRQTTTNPESAYQASRSGAYSGGTFAGSVNRFQQHDSSRQAASHSDSAINSTAPERSRNSFGWLLMLFLLLIALLIYWLWPSAKTVNNYQSTTSVPAAKREAVEPARPAQTRSMDSSLNTDTQENTATTVAPTHEETPPTDSSSNEVYRLEGKDVSVTVERTSKQHDVVKEPVQEPLSSSGENQSTVKPGYHEFVHIVVKGDTLWDIAKRYLKNPFRYPELAKLSAIKNPDLIYPGDTVRIRARDDNNSN